ncbi:MAG: DUF2103 domain-containing protein, partial [Planctomycetota bacterium]
MKFGKVKREHGRVRGLDEICDRIVRECDVVSRIVPGRINRRRGNGPKQLKVQYATPAGLKCQYTMAGSVQEVFLICTDDTAAEA